MLMSFFILGLVAGTVAGLAGIGGGAIIIPGLLLIFRRAGFDVHHALTLAIGTSLTVVFFTSCASLRTHWQRGNVHFKSVFEALPSFAVGIVAGTTLAASLPTRWLQMAFDCLLTWSVF